MAVVWTKICYPRTFYCSFSSFSSSLLLSFGGGGFYLLFVAKLCGFLLGGGQFSTVVLLNPPFKLLIGHSKKLFQNLFCLYWCWCRVFFRLFFVLFLLLSLSPLLHLSVFFLQIFYCLFSCNSFLFASSFSTWGQGTKPLPCGDPTDNAGIAGGLVQRLAICLQRAGRPPQPGPWGGGPPRGGVGLPKPKGVASRLWDVSVGWMAWHCGTHFPVCCFCRSPFSFLIAQSVPGILH